jgi:hypothetical protein
MSHIVKDLFRGPISQLPGQALHSLNRLTPPLVKGSLLGGLSVLLSSESNSVPDKLTAGSFPTAGFSVRQA